MESLVPTFSPASCRSHRRGWGRVHASVPRTSGAKWRPPYGRVPFVAGRGVHSKWAAVVELWASVSTRGIEAIDDAVDVHHRAVDRQDQEILGEGDG